MALNDGDLRDLFRRWREKPSLMVRQLFGVEPDAWQADVLDAFPTHQRIAMPSAKGPGKAGRKDEMIPTCYGDMRFGDLVVGDYVFGVDGRPTRVTAVHDRGVRPVFRVSFDDGSSTIVCGEHLWRVRGATQRRKLGQPWVTIDTNEIVRRGVRVKNGRWAGRQWEIPRHGPLFLPPRVLPLDPYFVGVWLGDGVKGQPAYCKPYVEVEHELNRRGYATSRGADGKAVRIQGSTKAFRRLEGHELGSHERFIPEEYRWASIDQREDLLRGLMDTDGCIGDDSHMEYDTTSERLANDVVWLVRSLGGVAFVKSGIKEGWYVGPDGGRVDCRDCYRVTVRTTFNPFLVPHKAARWKNPLVNASSERYLKRYIDAIEPAGVADTMCIEVADPEHLYLTNDFIVTHNTALLAWIGLHYMLCYPNCKCAAVSISGDNLRMGLWAELAKWIRIGGPLFESKFEWTTTAVFAKENPREWGIWARTWPQSGSTSDQANTLAGIHADHTLFLIDESGSMSDAVMVSADAALANANEGSGRTAHIVQAGNPTQLSGPLYRAWRNENKLWYVKQVTGDPDDPKRSPRIDIKWARDQIAEHGRDNIWVKTNVFGEFPQEAINSLISLDEVRASMRRYYRDYQIGPTPRILGVDVALYGDDSSVIASRQGIQAFPFQTYRNMNGPQGASQVIRRWNDFNADACFIDSTGGFGSSWIDQLKLLGRTPIGVHFAQKSANRLKYENKRAEMYQLMADWIRAGGALPLDEELVQDLASTTYTVDNGPMKIEPKALIKKKQNGRSPDKADALALTFAEPVTAQAPLGRNRHTFSWEPFGEVDRRVSAEYDPYGGS